MILARTPFAWFTEEDTEILGDRICSRCYQEIQELPITLVQPEPLVARFHADCWNQLVESGLIERAK